MRKKKTEELAEFFTKQNVADYLKVSTKTVERMFADGLESFKLRGKRYVTKSNLVDFINRNSMSA